MLAAIRRPVSNLRFLSQLAAGMEKHGVVPDVIKEAPQETAVVWPRRSRGARLARK